MNLTEICSCLRSSLCYAFLRRRGAVAAFSLVPLSPFLSLVLGSAPLSLVLRARLKVFFVVRPISRRFCLALPQAWEVGMPANKKRSPAPPPCVVHPNAAAIDVGGEAHVVAVPADRDAQPVRTFGVFTAD